jgi:hypothetical protein
VNEVAPKQMKAKETMMSQPKVSISGKAMTRMNLTVFMAELSPFWCQSNEKKTFFGVVAK